MLHKEDSLGVRKTSPPQPVCMTPDKKGMSRENPFPYLSGDRNGKMPPRSPTWASDYSHLASASYLADLRNNRPARPTGSRPLPPKPPQSQDENLPPRTGSALSFRSPNERPAEEKMVSREQKLMHRASMPVTDSLAMSNSQKGRPLVPSPGQVTPISRPKVLSHTVASPGTEYREATSRVIERQEAHSLRAALERIDQLDEEERIHNAAKMEAADLVWRHKNPRLAEVEKVAAYRNPDLDKPKYGELSHAKKDSVEGSRQNNSRSTSGESTESNDNKRPRLPWLKKRTKTDPVSSQPPQREASVQKEATRSQNLVGKTSGKRQVSSGSSKGVFRNPEDEIYEEAEEMPSATDPPPPNRLPLKSREQNSLRGSRPLPEKSFTTPLPEKKFDRFEIWKNPPTQSRNAGYTAARALPQTPLQDKDCGSDDSPRTRALEIRSEDIRAATSMKKSDRSPKLPTPTAVSDRPGRPIVSFDPKWRPGNESPRGSGDLERPQAKTDGSMAYPVKPTPPVPEITIMEEPKSIARREVAEERVQTLPAGPISMPSIKVTSDEPAEPAQIPRPLPQISLPSKTTSTSIAPSINVSSDERPISAPNSRPLPRVNLPNDTNARCDVPVISVQPEESRSRPLPSIHGRINVPSRPLPSPAQSSPSRLPPRPTQAEIASRVPWLSKTPSSYTSSSVTCVACSLPISGRIVTASGSATRTQKARFHPACFTCHHCSTGLECVSFYPEPENARRDRINAYMPHLDADDPQIQQLVQSNEDLHFFCHLDYHELFSPRCHNCKTPIEGAVVMALGRHYHADHFFCAECGDPFTAESPFVEHNDYPYCVSCHTKRTSARCRACKQPILNETTIEALGGRWHDQCFVCCECGGNFGEEGRFFVREIDVELTEKEKRKGVGRKVEEKAACQACEERRVKNVDIFV